MSKFISAIFLAILIAAPVFVTADHSNIHTIDQITTQLQKLKEQIRLLQSSVSQSALSPVTSTPGSTGGAKPVEIAVPVPVTNGSAGRSQMQPSVPISIPPAIFGGDTSDDDIVQLNNLRIQSISSQTLPAVISASYDFGTGCHKFKTLDEGAGKIVPCPLAPSILYQIKVDHETRLLLRNRQKATLADFEVGDRINVYGFMDRDTMAVEALIIRNLDKPHARRFIQLNNVEVVSAPSAKEPPAEFSVVQKHGLPCLDYGERGEAGGKAFPCPVGIGVEQKDANVSSYYPLARKYIIKVNHSTRIVQRDRTPMPLSEITVGDKLNIYGIVGSDRSIIEALVIRDLSKPAAKSGTLHVVVYDSSVVCARPLLPPSVFSPGSATDVKISQTTTLIYPEFSPCGVIYNATVVLEKDGVGVAKESTEKGFARFEHIPVGKYIVRAHAPKYETGATEVFVEAGGVHSIKVALKPLVGSGENLPPVIHGVSGSTLLKAGETGTWSLKASDPENGTLTYSVSWGDEIKPLATALEKEALIQRSTFTHSYQVAGVYTVTFVVTDEKGAGAKTTIDVKVVGGETVLKSVDLTADKVSGEAPLKVNFTATLKNFPSCGNTYVWDFGEGRALAMAEACPHYEGSVSSVVPSRIVSQEHIYQAAGIYKVYLRVNNVYSNTLIIQVPAAAHIVPQVQIQTQ